jgi:transposase-like protein
LNELTDQDWAAIQRAYETGQLSIQAICRHYNIPKSTLYTAVHQRGWTMRKALPPAGRGALIDRLFRVLDRQITTLETTMTKNGDKEVSLLGNLAKTLEKLIEIEDRERKGRKTPQNSREMAELQSRIAQRIDRISKQ